jgi:hypothetical protein
MNVVKEEQIDLNLNKRRILSKCIFSDNLQICRLYLTSSLVCMGAVAPRPKGYSVSGTLREEWFSQC